MEGGGGGGGGGGGQVRHRSPRNSGIIQVCLCEPSYTTSANTLNKAPSYSRHKSGAYGHISSEKRERDRKCTLGGEDSFS